MAHNSICGCSMSTLTMSSRYVVLCVVLGVCILLAVNSKTEARSIRTLLLCECENGGHVFPPRDPFSKCRCLCQAGFVGPKCELRIGKKRSESNNKKDFVKNIFDLLNVKQMTENIRRRQILPGNYVDELI